MSGSISSLLERFLARMILISFDSAVLKPMKAKRGITVVEATFISSITILLGLVLIFLASGWAQASMHDLTKETDKHVQSFRSLLAVELINYTEAGGEIRLRNVSKWNISLMIKEIEVLKDGEVIGQFPENAFIAKNEVTSLPIPIDCKRGESLTLRIKYVPAALSERNLPPLVIEVNSTCLISTVPLTCSLPERWAFIDVIDPITTLSGELSKAYPFTWIRVPLSPATGDENLNINVHGREGASSDSFHIKVPNAEQLPLRISSKDIEPPYNITLEGTDLFYIPRNVRLGGLVDGDEVKVHVSGITLLWRPEDRIVEGIIIELGVLNPGSYIIKLSLENCNGDDLLALEMLYSCSGNEGGWDFIYMEFIKEVKLTDIHSIKTSIIGVSP